MNAEASSNVTLEERFDGYPQAERAISSLRQLWQTLNDYEPASDEEAPVRENWLGALDLALHSASTIEPLLFEGPLASRTATAAESVTAQLASGISASSAAAEIEPLHELIGRITSLPPGEPSARPLAHLADDAQR